DEQVVTDAVQVLGTDAPDLSWIYLEYTDDMGHRYGDSPQLEEAVRLFDRQLARIDSVLKDRRRRFGEDWLLVVTTDHGRDSLTGKHHGRQSRRERETWILTNRKEMNRYFLTGTPAIVDIYPTLARHLGIRLPEPVRREGEGVPLVGPLSLARPTAARKDGQLEVTWQVWDSAGTVQVWGAAANQFRSGGTDTYRLLGTFPLAAGRGVLRLEDTTPLFKIVLEGPHNSVPVWIGATQPLKP
ncbi:MAG TPA: alkaline phosphatase family protein, partial [Chitinophagaceae bacterium]|nr:alkaline phosphatase family protein [Chitinophagaceae bacterium]